MKKCSSLKTLIKKCLIGFCVTSLLGIPTLVFSGDFESTSQIQSTSEARIAVEKAWDVYHHAALGGTLASPTVQSQMESNLHQSRALLAEAYEADERNDQKTAKNLIQKIIQITNTVIAGSQEPKQ